MSLNLTVDIRDLYKALCPECKAKLVKLVKIAPDGEAIRKALEAEEVKKDGQV
jgi:hypothetical protein